MRQHWCSPQQKGSTSTKRAADRIYRGHESQKPQYRSFTLHPSVLKPQIYDWSCNSRNLQELWTLQLRSTCIRLRNEDARSYQGPRLAVQTVRALWTPPKFSFEHHRVVLEPTWSNYPPSLYTNQLEQRCRSNGVCRRYWPIYQESLLSGLAAMVLRWIVSQILHRTLQCHNGVKLV